MDITIQYVLVLIVLGLSPALGILILQYLPEPIHNYFKNNRIMATWFVFGLMLILILILMAV